MPDLISLPSLPYPEVELLLRDLRAGVREILGETFVGMYLYGSLACGDFDAASDIDFLVVTETNLPEDVVSSLRKMHTKFAMEGGKWGEELEGSYIPREALRRYDPARALHPHLERGGFLVVEPHASDWVIQRQVLRERGVTLAGPPPAALIDPVTPDEMQRALLALLASWWEPMLQDPFRLLDLGYQSYAVLTMCRILYTLERGTVVSKPVAAQWAKETLAESWRARIDWALACRLQPSEGNVEEALAFIRFTVERARRFSLPG